MVSLRLSGRDREIVLALVQKVRMLSQRQLARYWWAGDMSNVRKRMQRLADASWVSRCRVLARPTPELVEPLLSWTRSEATPDFGAVAYRTQQRWRHRPTRMCTVWIASEQSSRLYGGEHRGSLHNPLQATHDLGVAEVWLRLREVSPVWADAWRSEDQMAHTRRGEKIPDAFIVDERDQVVWVIEFAGAYDAQRIRDFHDDCANRGLGYQLW